MARRASSGLNPGIILAAVVVVGVVVFGGKQLLSKDSVAFEGTPRLQIEDVLENGNALRENVYVVEGEIDSKLQITSSGQLLSVKVDGPKGDEFIGVHIPSSLSERNIEIKQKYAFKIKFKKGGIAIATDIERL